MTSEKAVTRPRKIKASELFYEDYSETAVPGDDPTKRKEDSDRYSRKEKYEVVDMINSIAWKDDKNSLNDLLIVEWMLHDKLPSTTQGRANVKAWVYAEYNNLKPLRPSRLKD